MNADPPRLAAIDLGAVGVVSLAIALAADRLVLMTVLVPLVIVARFALLARERVALGPEIAFFALCTVLGRLQRLELGLPPPDLRLHGPALFRVYDDPALDAAFLGDDPPAGRPRRAVAGA